MLTGTVKTGAPFGERAKNLFLRRHEKTGTSVTFLHLFILFRYTCYRNFFEGKDKIIKCKFVTDVPFFPVSIGLVHQSFRFVRGLDFAFRFGLATERLRRPAALRGRSSALTASDTFPLSKMMSRRSSVLLRRSKPFKR